MLWAREETSWKVEVVISLERMKKKVDHCIRQGSEANYVSWSAVSKADRRF